MANLPRYSTCVHEFCYYPFIPIMSPSSQHSSSNFTIWWKPNIAWNPKWNMSDFNQAPPDLTPLHILISIFLPILSFFPVPSKSALYNYFFEIIKGEYSPRTLWGPLRSAFEHYNPFLMHDMASCLILPTSDPHHWWIEFHKKKIHDY